MKFDFEFSIAFWYGVLSTFRTKSVLQVGYRFHLFIQFACSIGRHNIKTVYHGLCQLTEECSSKMQQFLKVLFILHSVNALRFGQTTFDSEVFTELIREVSWQQKVVKSKYHNFPKPSKASLVRSYALFLRAQDLMENLNGLNSPQEFRLVSQLSKEILRKALCCDDLKSNAIRGVALAYMAALYFY